MADPSEHVEAIAERVRDRGLTIGAAESLTGGAVSSALARGAGASEWCAHELHIEGDPGEVVEESTARALRILLDALD